MASDVVQQPVLTKKTKFVGTSYSKQFHPDSLSLSMSGGRKEVTEARDNVRNSGEMKEGWRAGGERVTKRGIIGGWGKGSDNEGEMKEKER